MLNIVAAIEEPLASVDQSLPSSISGTSLEVQPNQIGASKPTNENSPLKSSSPKSDKVDADLSLIFGPGASDLLNTNFEQCKDDAH